MAFIFVLIENFVYRMLPEEKARGLVEDLVRSPTDFTLDPALLESTRRSAADIITSVLEGSSI